MIIDKKKAKKISQSWGWKQLPRKGKQYIHAGILFTQYLENDEGTFKLYHE